MLVGDKIRKARENRGISHEHLAAKLNLDVRMVEKIENNKRDLYIGEARTIAEELECSAQELIFGEPRLVFDNCHQNGEQGMLYNNGTLNPTSGDHSASAYELAISTLRQSNDDKDKIIALLEARVKELGSKLAE